jgi:hypothetical protein
VASGEKDDLTGVWDGEYSYARHLSPTRFTAVVLDLGGAFSGTVYETPPDGPGAGKERSAWIEGSRGGRQVSFVKTYEVAKGAVKNPVRYEGTLDADGVQITGTWRINAGWTGSFVMTRPERSQAAAEEKREALEPVG